MNHYDYEPPIPDAPQNLDELVPHAREAEEALLGSVLINPAWIKVLDIRARDFHIHRHGMIWTALQELHAEETRIDFITLCDRLEKKSLLAEIGGPAYLTGLVNVTPTSLHTETYARILRDRTARRELINLANETARQAFNLQTPVTSIQSKLIEKVIAANQEAQGSVPLAQWMTRIYDYILEAEANGTPPGIETGFIDFDKITGGIKPGRFEILSGIPGMGKSIFYQNVATNLAKKNCPGNFYSAEMPERDMSLRILSAETGIEVSRLESGKLLETEHPILANALDELSSLPLYVSDANGWTIPTLRADLTRAQAERGVRWFVFDYMDLLRDEYGDNETERTKYLSRHLRAICRDLGLYGMAIQSLVKSGFSNPSMEHLAGSAGLAYDADLIMFITEHMPDKGGIPDPHIRTVLIKKGRHLQNANRYFYLFKHGHLPKFENSQKNTVYLNGSNGHPKTEREILEFAP